jgi:hypothetical protein
MAGRSARPSGVVPPNQRMQPDAVPATEIVAIVRGIMEMKAVPIYRGGAADAQRVGRARATHAMNGQRMIQPRDCRGLTANARESGIRARSQGTHPVPGQAITGKACGRHHGARIRPPSWWERNRRQRPRAVSQAAHPTVITPVSAGKKRIRTPSQVAPSGASTSGRSARPSGVVPPNQRMQPDAVPASEIAPILRGIRVEKAFPIDLAARLMREAFGRQSNSLISSRSASLHRFFRLDSLHTLTYYFA